MTPIVGHENQVYMRNMITLTDEKQIQDYMSFISLLRNGGRVEIERPLQIDPYYGSYGLTGYIFTIQGTPPPATMVIDLERRLLWILPTGMTRSTKTIGDNYYSYNTKASDTKKYAGFYSLTKRILEYAGLRTEYGFPDNKDARAGLCITDW